MQPKCLLKIVERRGPQRPWPCCICRTVLHPIRSARVPRFEPRALRFPSSDKRAFDHSAQPDCPRQALSTKESVKSVRAPLNGAARSPGNRSPGTCGRAQRRLDTHTHICARARVCQEAADVQMSTSWICATLLGSLQQPDKGVGGRATVLGNRFLKPTIQRDFCKSERKMSGSFWSTCTIIAEGRGESRAYQ